jgi:biotin carboxylase
VLLLVPTETYRAGAFLAAASALGAGVVVGSERQQALAGTMGENFVLVPLDDPAEAARVIAAHAEHAPLDAIVALDDQGVVAAAHAASLLGLARHNPPAAVEATRDKATMRSLLARAGVPQPRYLLASDAARAAEEIGVPVVLKPLALSASRGVIRVDSLDSVEEVAARVRLIAGNDGPILVEEYLDGPEVALEGLLADGVLRVLAVFDKPEPLTGPYFEETVYVTPSRLGTSLLARIAEVAGQAAAALGLVEGPVHAELRLVSGGDGIDGGDVRLIEVAARTIGGRCAKALSFAEGRSLEELVIARALGIDLGPGAFSLAEGAFGVMMLPIPVTGVLSAVECVDEAAAIPGVTGVEITATVGREIRALPEGDRYLGFIFAAAATPADVEAALGAAYRALRIVIDELR